MVQNQKGSIWRETTARAYPVIDDNVLGSVLGNFRFGEPSVMTKVSF